MAAKDETKTTESAPKNATKTTDSTQTADAAGETQNTGAVSAEQQAVRTGVSSDALNPAFAAPEVQEQIKKDWEGGAEHTVDAEQVLKEQEGNTK